MANKAPTTITGKQSATARDQLMLTQKTVMAETGISGFKFKNFELGYWNLSDDLQQELIAYYQSKGFDFGQFGSQFAGAVLIVQENRYVRVVRHAYAHSSVSAMAKRLR